MVHLRSAVPSLVAVSFSLRFLTRNLGRNHNQRNSTRGESCTKICSNAFTRKIAVNRWTHVGFTFDLDSHSLSIYFNGKLDKTTVGKSTWKNLRNYEILMYKIGKVIYGKSVLHYKGYMKDMVMLPRVLQPFEMVALLGE